MQRVANSVQLISGGNVIKQGDETPFVFRLSDETGKQVSLQGATVLIKIANDKAIILDKPATVNSDDTISFYLTKEDVTGHGNMRLEFIVTFSDGKQEKFPADGWQQIKITPSLTDLGNVEAVAIITIKSLQAQIDEIAAGSTNAETSQARVNADGSVTYGTLKERLDTEHTDVKEQIKQRGVNIWDYEHLIPNKNVASDMNQWDWTNAIKQAIDDAFNKGVGKVVLPHYGTGDYLTDPISFQGYKGITLVGEGSLIDLNVPYLWGNEDKSTKHVRIKFKSSGTVGLQFSDTTSPNPTWKAPHCKIENIWVCGNDLVDACINGNYGITLKNVWASHAIYDGVVFEDYTYPALIEDSQLGPNGRHGLFVKGPMTTVFTLRRVNSSLNSGYGYHLIGGSGANFIDCLAQSNSQGGLKITKRNDLYGALENNFLDKLLFNNFYSEANGKLSPTDPNYEGNYALVIDATSGSNVMGQTEVRSITFSGGALNHSTNGGSYNIQRVVGLTLNETSVNHSKGVINAGECQGLKVGVSSTVAGATAPYPFISKYTVKDNTKSLEVYNGGILTKRGRVHSIPFFADSLVAGTSKEMTLAFKENANNINAYPLKEGSIVGIKLIAPIGGNSGSVKLSIISKPFGQSGGLGYLAHEDLTLDLATTEFADKWYEPLTHKIATGTYLGLRVHPQSDLVLEKNSVMGYLLIEE